MVVCNGGSFVVLVLESPWVSKHHFKASAPQGRQTTFDIDFDQLGGKLSFHRSSFQRLKHAFKSWRSLLFYRV